jgi:hypothetical protein
MTSLSKQLENLRARPEHEKRLTKSFLFSTADANQFSREQIHELGLNGMRTLVALDNRFDAFLRVLFDPQHVRRERVMLTAEENKEIDGQISALMTRLAPHIFLTAAHQVVEYLVRVYEVQQFNVKTVLRLALPVHDQGIFVRLIAMLDLRGTGFDFLKDNQLKGATLSRSMLVVACGENRKVLQMVCQCATQAIEAGVTNHAAAALWLGVSTALAVSPHGEAAFRVLLPITVDWLASTNPNIASAALVSLCAWCTETALASTTLAVLCKALITTVANAGRSENGVSVSDALRASAHVFNSQRAAMSDAAMAPVLRQFIDLAWSTYPDSAISNAAIASPSMLTQLLQTALSQAQHDGATTFVTYAANHAPLSDDDVSEILSTAAKYNTVGKKKAGKVDSVAAHLLSTVKILERRFGHALDKALVKLIDTAQALSKKSGDATVAQEMLAFVTAHFSGGKYDMVEFDAEEDGNKKTKNAVPTFLPVVSCLMSHLARVRLMAVEKLTAADSAGSKDLAGMIELVAHTATFESEETVAVAIMKLCRVQVATFVSGSTAEQFNELVSAVGTMVRNFTPVNASAAAPGVLSGGYGDLLKLWLKTAVAKLSKTDDNAVSKLSRVRFAVQETELLELPFAEGYSKLHSIAANGVNDFTSAASSVWRSALQQGLKWLVADAANVKRTKDDPIARKWTVARLQLCVAALGSGDNHTELLKGRATISKILSSPSKQEDAQSIASAVAAIVSFAAATQIEDGKPAPPALARDLVSLLVGAPTMGTVIANLVLGTSAANANVAQTTTQWVLSAVAAVMPNDASAVAVINNVAQFAAPKADPTAVALAVIGMPNAAGHTFPAVAAARQKCLAAVASTSNSSSTSVTSMLCEALLASAATDGASDLPAPVVAIIDKTLKTNASTTSLCHQPLVLARAVDFLRTTAVSPQVAIAATAGRVKTLMKPNEAVLAANKGRHPGISAEESVFLDAVVECLRSTVSDANAGASSVWIDLTSVILSAAAVTVVDGTTLRSVMPGEPLLDVLLHPASQLAKPEGKAALEQLCVPLVEMFAQGCGAPVVSVFSQSAILLDNVSRWIASFAAANEQLAVEDAAPAKKKTRKSATAPQIVGSAADTVFSSRLVTSVDPLLELLNDVFLSALSADALPDTVAPATFTQLAKLTADSFTAFVYPALRDVSPTPESAWCCSTMTATLSLLTNAVTAVCIHGDGEAVRAPLAAVFFNNDADSGRMLKRFAVLVLSEDLAVGQAASTAAAALVKFVGGGATVADDVVGLLANAVSVAHSSHDQDDDGEVKKGGMISASYVPAISRLLHTLLPTISATTAASDASAAAPASKIFTMAGAKGSKYDAKKKSKKQSKEERAEADVVAAATAMTNLHLPIVALLMHLAPSRGKALRHHQPEEIVRDVLLSFAIQDQLRCIVGITNLFTRLINGFPAIAPEQNVIAEMATLFDKSKNVSTSIPIVFRLLELLTGDTRFITAFVTSNSADVAATESSATKTPASVYMKVVVSGLELFAAAHDGDHEVPAADLLSRLLSMVDEATFTACVSNLILTTPTTLADLIAETRGDKTSSNGAMGESRRKNLRRKCTAVRLRGLEVLYDRLTTSVEAASSISAASRFDTSAALALTNKSIPVLSSLMKAARKHIVPTTIAKSSKKNGDEDDEAVEDRPEAELDDMSKRVTVSDGHAVEFQWIVVCVEECSRLFGASLERNNDISVIVDFFCRLGADAVAETGASSVESVNVSPMSKPLATVVASLLTAVGGIAQAIGYGFMSLHAAEALSLVTNGLIYGTSASVVVDADAATPAKVVRRRAVASLLRLLPSVWIMIEPKLVTILTTTSTKLLAEDDVETVADVRNLFWTLDSLLEPRVMLPCLSTTAQNASPKTHSFALIFEAIQKLIGKLTKKELKQFPELMDCSLFTNCLERFAAQATLPSQPILDMVFAAFSTFFVKFKEETCIDFVSRIGAWALEKRPSDEVLSRRDVQRWSLSFSLFESVVSKLQAVSTFIFPVISGQLVEVFAGFCDHGSRNDRKNIAAHVTVALDVAFALVLAMSDTLCETNKENMSAGATGGNIPIELQPFFARKETFSGFMTPLVAQMANTTYLADDRNSYEERIENVVIPSIRRFFRSLDSPKLWSTTQKQLVQHLRHQSWAVRKATLSLFRGIYADGGDELCALIMAEALPAIVEATEDERDAVVEEASQLCQELSTITAQDVLHAMS